MNAKRLEQIAAIKKSARKRDKNWEVLSSHEKDRLLEAVCRMLGLFGGDE